ncbi:hypothetical protein [Salinibacter ruber]|uniref:hypothetical protein n=1 Tax=Salinibacter ruber TaxID=146919 RepID=UPI00207405CA|nr:hypothetical protein [Salinibacter ruber]
MPRDLISLLRDLTSRFSSERLDLEDLQSAARAAFERFDGSQNDLGDALGIDRAAISRAVRKTGLKHASVQARIVSYVRGEPVQRRSTYRGRSVEHRWIVGLREEPKSSA